MYKKKQRKMENYKKLKNRLKRKKQKINQNSINLFWNLKNLNIIVFTFFFISNNTAEKHRKNTLKRKQRTIYLQLNSAFFTFYSSQTSSAVSYFSLSLKLFGVQLHCMQFSLILQKINWDFQFYNFRYKSIKISSSDHHHINVCSFWWTSI